jgi:hypothetical protein
MGAGGAPPSGRGRGLAKLLRVATDGGGGAPPRRASPEASPWGRRRCGRERRVEMVGIGWEDGKWQGGRGEGEGLKRN